MKTSMSVRSIASCNILLILGLLLFVGLPSRTNAQPSPSVKWESDVSRAVNIAKETNRLLFIHFHGNNCPPCKAMDEQVFADPRVIAKLNNHFVSVKADVAHNAPLAKQLDIVAIPTNIVLNAKGQMVNRRQGGITPDRFLEYLDYLQTLTPSAQIANTQMPPSSSAVSAAPVAAAVEAVNQNPNALLDPFTKKPVAPAAYPAPVEPSPVPSVAANVPAPAAPPVVAAPAVPPPAPLVPIAVSVPVVTPPPSVPATDPFATVQAAPAAPVPAAPVPVSPISTPIPMPNAALVQASSAPMPQPAIVPVPRETTPAVAQMNSPIRPAEMVIANNAPAADPTPCPNTPPLTVEVPLGLEGYCPVVLGLEERWIPGNPAFYAMYRGQIYRFSNQAALDQFQGNPLKFSPVAMGEDVVLMVDRNKKANGTRKFGAWYEGRVYLFSCQETLSVFAANPEYYADIAQKYETAFRTPADAVQR